MKPKAWLLVLTLAAPLPPQAQAQLSEVGEELNAKLTRSQAYKSLQSGAFDLPVIGETSRKFAAMTTKITKAFAGMEPPSPNCFSSQSASAGSSAGKPQAKAGGGPGGCGVGGDPISKLITGVVTGVKKVVCGLFGCLFGKK
ncbi:MAG: hypothetical protein WC728_08335 [Elusimicrobiota bacterium]